MQTGVRRAPPVEMRDNGSINDRLVSIRGFWWALTSDRWSHIHPSVFLSLCPPLSLSLYLYISIAPIPLFHLYLTLLLSLSFFVFLSVSCLCLFISMSSWCFVLHANWSTPTYLCAALWGSLLYIRIPNPCVQTLFISRSRQNIHHTSSMPCYNPSLFHKYLTYWSLGYHKEDKFSSEKFSSLIMWVCRLCIWGTKGAFIVSCH